MIQVEELKTKMKGSGMPWPGDEGEKRWQQAWTSIKKVRHIWRRVFTFYCSHVHAQYSKGEGFLLFTVPRHEIEIEFSSYRFGLQSGTREHTSVQEKSG